MFISVVGQNDHEFDITLSDENAGDGKIALLLPGLGYRLENPIFYFAEKLLIDLGFQIARTNYAYDKIGNLKELQLEDAMKILAQDASEIGKAVQSLPDHNELILVGKSLGTILMANLIAQKAILPSRLAWLTPSIAAKHVDEQINAHALHSFVAIGTNDKYYDKSLLEKYQKSGAYISVLDDVGHVLECENNVVKSINAHQQMISAMSDWLKS